MRVVVRGDIAADPRSAHGQTRMSERDEKGLISVSLFVRGIRTCVHDMRAMTPWLLYFLMVAIAVGFVRPAFGQASVEPAASATRNGVEQRPDGFPVVVFNRRVALMRAPLFGIASDVRAIRTERRIHELLAHGGPGRVAVQAEEQGNLVLIDGEMAIALVPGDADPLAGESLHSITQRTQQALAEAIAVTRESRDRGRIVRALASAMLATVGLVLGLWIIRAIRRVVFTRISSALVTRAAAVTVAGAPLLIAPVRRLIRVSVWTISWAAIGILLYEWLSFTLKQFPFTRPWGEALSGYILSVGQRFAIAIAHAVPDLVVAAFILLLARAVTSGLSPLFERIENGKGKSSWLDSDTVAPTRRLVNIGVWLFAIAMAYPYLPGADSEAFKGLSVLVGLMLTLGGASLVGQGASGLILMYSRTLRVGEYVRIADQEGTVIELGAFTTKIRTGLGEEVAIPNSVVLGNATKNYSRAVKGDGYVVDTVVTIGYDTPWRDVNDMLIAAAQRTPGVLGSPAPQVFQTALSDFYVEYRLVCQAIPAEPRPRAEVLAALHRNVLDVFNENGVQIMSPHYLGDPTSPKLVPQPSRSAGPASQVMRTGPQLRESD
jgi:small-conductance mechanosensitive channel